MDTLFGSLIVIALVGVAITTFLVKILMKSASREKSVEPAFAKKFSFADIEKYRFLIGNVALALSIVLILTAFEWKTFDEVKLPTLVSQNSSEESIDVAKITEQKLPPPVKIMVQPEIKIVDDKKVIEKIEAVFTPEEAQNIDTSKPVIFEKAPELEPEEDDDVIFLVVEESATPAGGMEGFMKYLQKNLKYPRQARKMGIEGKVYVQFVVDKDGAVVEVKAIKGIGGGCDEEAIRVLQESPKWKAGKQRGRPVKQRVVVPIAFTLSK